MLDLEFPIVSTKKLLPETTARHSSVGNVYDRHYDEFRREHPNLLENTYKMINQQRMLPSLSDWTGSNQV